MNCRPERTLNFEQFQVGPWGWLLIKYCIVRLENYSCTLVSSQHLVFSLGGKAGLFLPLFECTCNVSSSSDVCTASGQADTVAVKSSVATWRMDLGGRLTGLELVFCHIQCG